MRQVVDGVIGRDQPTILLHLGDFDPSGESIFTSLTSDAWSFVVGETQDNEMLDYRRVALIAEQVEEFNLPTAPPKASDSRSANWRGETCQLEAMPPDLLAELTRTTIEGEFDMDTYNELLEVEEQDRGALTEAVEEFLA